SCCQFAVVDQHAQLAARANNKSARRRSRLHRNARCPHYPPRGRLPHLHWRQRIRHQLPVVRRVLLLAHSSRSQGDGFRPPPRSLPSDSANFLFALLSNLRSITLHAGLRRKISVPLRLERGDSRFFLPLPTPIRIRRALPLRGPVHQKAHSIAHLRNRRARTE